MRLQLVVVCLVAGLVAAPAFAHEQSDRAMATRGRSVDTPFSTPTHRQNGGGFR